jgi:hypothetical protein
MNVLDEPVPPGQGSAAILETARARVPHWASKTRVGDWARSFPCFQSIGKIIMVAKPDRSLSLKQTFMRPRRENVSARTRSDGHGDWISQPNCERGLRKEKSSGD